MKKYEELFADYARYILGIQEILNDKDWQENLNDLADLIFLSHTVRGKLEKEAPKSFLAKLEKWDRAFMEAMEELKRKHKPMYGYFRKVWADLTLILLHHPSPAKAVGSATKS